MDLTESVNASIVLHVVYYTTGHFRCLEKPYLSACGTSCLRAFPFLDSDVIIDGLKAKLSAYMAAAEDVVIPTEEKKFELWCGH